MKLVVDAVISTAISECENPDKVSQTVKAFIDAQIPAQLLCLLEKVVMGSPQFQKNTSLQNLLIVTAIKEDKSRVMEYVTLLNEYSWDKICSHLIIVHLYDEAIAAYKKFGQNVEAVNIMLTYNEDIKAALEWAQNCDEPIVWAEVAYEQLSKGQVVDVIDSFIKAKNPREYDQIIKVAEEQNEYNALVQLARQMLNRNEIIDTKLCYAYAKTNMLNELKELISSPKAVRIKEVADRCFNDKLFEACNILYTVINDTTKLAEILNLMNPK